MSHPTTEETTDPNVVHVIQSTYHSRDEDGRPTATDSILENEGWFADAESAAIRCAQLNEQNRSIYDVAMSRAKRDRESKIAAAEQTNREAAILRANGIEKPSVYVPAEFVPTPFEGYVPDHSHTSYAVMSIDRSDHDGIAQAVDPD